MILDLSVTCQACPFQQELHRGVLHYWEVEEDLLHPLLPNFMIFGQIECVAVVWEVQPPELHGVNADVNPSVGHRPDLNKCKDLFWIVKSHFPDQLFHCSLHTSLCCVACPSKERGVEFTFAREEAIIIFVSSLLYCGSIETWVETDLEEQRKFRILKISLCHSDSGLSGMNIGVKHIPKLKAESN